MAPEWWLDFQPQLPVQMASLETHLDVELKATSQENPPAEAMESISDLVMRLAQVMQQPPPVMLSKNSPKTAIQLVWKLATLETAKRRLLRDLGLPRMEKRLAQARLQELQLRTVEDSPVPLARVPRHSPSPGPCASSLKKLVARKCNRAARCGGRPIFARCRHPSNRRALAGCGNRHSRWQRKRVRRAEPFPIVASDNDRCLPRRIAD
jgi:hypothetical protein